MRVWGPLYDIILSWNIVFFLYVVCTIWRSFNKGFFLILISGPPDIVYFMCPPPTHTQWYHNELEFRKKHINVVICANRIIYFWMNRKKLASHHWPIEQPRHWLVSDFQKFNIVQQKIEANSQKVISFSNRYLDVKIKPSEVPFVNHTHLYSPSQWIKWQSSVCKSNSVHVRFRLRYDWSVL